VKKPPFSPEEREAWTPPEDLTVSQCADKYRVLSGKSAKSGPWETSHNPIARAFMDSFGIDCIREIWLVKPTQSSGTESLLNMLLYAVLQDPGPALFAEPNENLADELSQERIDDMIRHCDALQSRCQLHEKGVKVFSNMNLYMAWAGSPVSLASRAIRYVFFDEVDKYRMFAGREASPLKLGSERTNTFREIMKKVHTSTPVLESDEMTQGEKQCDARFRFHVFCPHCGHRQQLTFEGIKYDSNLMPREIEETAFYECAGCKGAIREDERMEMIRRGVWVDMISGLDFGDCIQKIKPRSVGFQFWRVHTPWFTFGDIAAEFIRSKDRPSDLQNFKNSWLAEPWAEKGETKTEFQLLSRRIDLPSKICPDDAIAVVAGIDMGQGGYWFAAWAITPKAQKILVDYGFESFVGATAEEQRDKIRKFVFGTAYPSADGRFIYPVWRAGMDTGGGRDEEDETQTARAYSIIRAVSDGKRLLGIKGRSNSNSVAHVSLSVIDKMPGKQGKPIPGGLNLWLINTDAVKNDLSHYLGLPIESDGAAVFNQDVREDFIKHILAEERRKNKNGHWEWVQISAANHLLDCSVIALAMADRECWGGVDILHRPQRFSAPISPVIEQKAEEPIETGVIIENLSIPKAPGRRKGYRIISRGIE